ncbi:UDP-N-acetylmuramate--alanine ligase [Candidatus Chlamydia sanziniae]|uniref:D-alanine--D-alanine ligase n=2 Tax=Candidatus Chlamydia sanziniae TaxID=1806891 RepID=A0A1A9HXD9_9CHLA|nr:UDP-N-acetylmuramate--alanine ligase [Candidatus Chlamydia sanziniae]
MSALAHILLDRGCHVSGSDLHSGNVLDTLKSKGALCFVGHHESHVPDYGVVIYSSSISMDNIEYRTAVRKELQIMHRAQFLAQLMEGHTQICISGSHGKTLTTSLITAIFEEAKQDPSYAIGGIREASQNGYSGSSKIFIAEADESDGSLKYYVPHAAVITNIDNEHLSNYGGDINNLVNMVQDFAHKVTDHQKVFYNGDCPWLKDKIVGVSYGFSQECQLRIVSYSQKTWQSCFSFTFSGQTYEDVELNLAGKHNVANAAAACGIALAFDIDIRIVRRALANFVGVKRRLERKNISERFLFLEDYAHHPSEISSTLCAVRDAVGLRRIVAICQPHRFSRLQDCLHMFPKAFQDADEVILTDVYSAGETSNSTLFLPAFADQIAKCSYVRCCYVPYSDLVQYLQDYIRVHDVCISLGAGNIDTLGDTLMYFIPKKLCVAVICGGQSCEYDISILSAQHASKYISSEYYDVCYFIIDPQGQWRTGKDLLKLAKERQGYSVLSPEISQALAQVDFIVPILHGPFGEDGKIQGFFEILGKPYSGPSLPPAAISMDKLLTKRIASAVGVPVVPCQPLNLSTWKQSPEAFIKNVIETFTFPMVVKTAHLGSSLGIFLVHNEQELQKQLSEAFLYDTDVFVEESRLGSREIEVSCIGDSTIQYYIAEPHERCGAHGFIDYQEKYGWNGSVCPTISFNVELPEESLSLVKELTERVYRAIQGKGSARIDFFLDEEGKFWLSEINPIPGMTACSPFLEAFVQMGWTQEQLMHYFIIEGLYRFNKQQALQTLFYQHKELIEKS